MNLFEIAKAKNIKYFLISFVDLFGILRAKMVPAEAIREITEDGAGFAGFAAWMDMTPADPDTLGMLDPNSLIQLPWKPEVAWLSADLWMNGKAVDSCPRVVLQRQIEKMNALGLRPKTGVECEFFLINPQGDALADQMDVQEKPCYDQQALMRRYDVISEICDCMLSLGWNPYQNDHEDANGQFEMNWAYDDALVTADRHVFFKFMVKSIAEKHGMRATFMPKPFKNLTGNGCHSHISMWSMDGTENRFLDHADARGLGLSQTAYQFLGGILSNAQALCAMFNPTVNSFKRINAPVTQSGATWSPSAVTYGGNNRTHLVRVPDSGRFELRLMDGATNPYLLQAGVLAAGLDGLSKALDPGEPLNINMYVDAYDAKPEEKLPENLLDALRHLADSKSVRDQLGDPVVDAFVKLKTAEWRRFTSSISQWETQNTLDC